MGPLIIHSSVFVIPISCGSSSRLAFISLFSISLTISLSLSPLLAEAQRPLPVHSHSLAILPRHLAVHQAMAPYPLPFKSNKLMPYLRYKRQHVRVTVKVAPPSFNLVAGSRAVTMLAAAPVELRGWPERPLDYSTVWQFRERLAKTGKDLEMWAKQEWRCEGTR